MQRHSHEHIQLLKNDRRCGMSINALMRKYKIPKTSVWHHIKDIKLSQHQKNLLHANQGGSRERKQDDLRKADIEARRLLKNVTISKVAPVIFGALYWAEGHKKSFVFTNTDERMIRIFLKILRNYWNVGNNKIDLLIRITNNMDAISCIKHWKQATKLPLKNIRVNINNKQNKSKTKYGVCRITIKKGSYGLKVTHAIINQMITQAETM